MARAGQGYRFHMTGLTHNEKGYPDMSVSGQARLVGRLAEKITRDAVALTDVVSDQVDGAEAVVLSYGITSRVAQKAVQTLRAEGRRIGSLRLRTVWPFPERLVRDLATKVKAIVVPELNLGQMVREVERCASGARVVGVPHAGGTVHDPAVITRAITEALR
jgi:2-oxoglutarate ferredoxin oxidoreductase subunit alpha